MSDTHLEMRQNIIVIIGGVRQVAEVITVPTRPDGTTYTVRLGNGRAHEIELSQVEMER
jgi:hypothetical protein